MSNGMNPNGPQGVQGILNHLMQGSSGSSSVLQLLAMVIGPFLQQYLPGFSTNIGMQSGFGHAFGMQPSLDATRGMQTAMQLQQSITAGTLTPMLNAMGFTDEDNIKTLSNTLGQLDAMITGGQFSTMFTGSPMQMASSIMMSQSRLRSMSGPKVEGEEGKEVYNNQATGEDIAQYIEVLADWALDENKALDTTRTRGFDLTDIGRIVSRMAESDLIDPTRDTVDEDGKVIEQVMDRETGELRPRNFGDNVADQVGEAAKTLEAVKDVLAPGASVDEVWDILEQIYGKDGLIAESMESIRDRTLRLGASARQMGLSPMELQAYATATQRYAAQHGVGQRQAADITQSSMDGYNMYLAQWEQLRDSGALPEGAIKMTPEQFLQASVETYTARETSPFMQNIRRMTALSEQWKRSGNPEQVKMAEEFDELMKTDPQEAFKRYDMASPTAVTNMAGGYADTLDYGFLDAMAEDDVARQRLGEYAPAVEAHRARENFVNVFGNAVADPRGSVYRNLTEEGGLTDDQLKGIDLGKFYQEAAENGRSGLFTTIRANGDVTKQLNAMASEMTKPGGSLEGLSQEQASKFLLRSAEYEIGRQGSVQAAELAAINYYRTATPAGIQAQKDRDIAAKENGLDLIARNDEIAAKAKESREGKASSGSVLERLQKIPGIDIPEFKDDDERNDFARNYQDAAEVLGLSGGVGDTVLFGGKEFDKDDFIGMYDSSAEMRSRLAERGANTSDEAWRLQLMETSRSVLAKSREQHKANLSQKPGKEGKDADASLTGVYDTVDAGLEEKAAEDNFTLGSADPDGDARLVKKLEKKKQQNNAGTSGTIQSQNTTVSTQTTHLNSPEIQADSVTVVSNDVGSNLPEQLDPITELTPQEELAPPVDVSPGEEIEPGVDIPEQDVSSLKAPVDISSGAGGGAQAAGGGDMLLSGVVTSENDTNRGKVSRQIEVRILSGRA